MAPKMERRIAVATALACGLGASLVAAAPAGATDLTYASALPTTHPVHIAGLVPLAERLKPEIDLQIIPGGQLFGLGDGLQSVGNGIADMTITQPAYHPSELPRPAILFNLLLLTSNELAAAGATAETLYLDCPQCLEDYKRSNTLSLANIAIGGYSLMCRDDVDEIADIAGKRVRTSGSLGRWAEHLGGVPVSMTSAEMVESLQRGVLDCVMGFTAWLKAYGIEDSIKSIYFYDIGSTGAVSYVTINLDTWNGLSPEERQRLWDAMPGMIAGSMVQGYIKQDIEARELATEVGIRQIDGEAEITAIWEDYKASEVESVNANAATLGVSDAKDIAQIYLENYEKWVTIIDEAGLSEVSAGDALLTEEQLKAAQDAFEALLVREVYAKVDPSSL